jgi:hypothetical protein
MKNSPAAVALTDEVTRFENEIRRLAFALASQVLRQELDRKLPELGLELRPRDEQPQARRAPQPEPERTEPEPERTDLAAEMVAPHAETLPAEAPGPSAVGETVETPAVPPAAPAGSKRARWTRETIIAELATWTSKGTVIDAGFMTRHGPPGLVAATRRVFGRFEAAMNVVALHLAKLDPVSPPR